MMKENTAALTGIQMDIVRVFKKVILERKVMNVINSLKREESEIG